MALNTFWRIEAGNIGHQFRIDQHGLYWDSYDIPETRHSGGGSQHFPHSDLSSGSALYVQLVRCFGESLAKEMLYAVEHMEEIPELSKKMIATQKIDAWLKAIPENTALPIPWKDTSLKACVYSDGKFADLEKVGIKLSDENGVFILQDVASQKELLRVPRFHPFEFGQVNQTRIIWLYQYLYILHPDKAFVPFEDISAQWKVLDSEITLPYLSDEFIYVRFNLHRIYKDQGDYVIQLNHEGKILGKKLLVPSI